MRLRPKQIMKSSNGVIWHTIDGYWTTQTFADKGKPHSSIKKYIVTDNGGISFKLCNVIDRSTLNKVVLSHIDEEKGFVYFLSKDDIKQYIRVEYFLYFKHKYDLSKVTWKADKNAVFLYRKSKLLGAVANYGPRTRKCMTLDEIVGLTQEEQL